MRTEPNHARRSNLVSDRKARAVGIVTIAVFIVMTLAVFALKASRSREAQKDFSTARETMVLIASGEPCAEQVEHARELMKRRMHQNNFFSGLINRRALAYAWVLEDGRAVCAGGTLPEIPTKECNSLFACREKIIAAILNGQYETARKAGERGISIDDNSYGRFLAELARDLEREHSGR